MRSPSKPSEANFPGASLDIPYTYDDLGVPFSKGRLTRILRDGQAIDYRYDRFGRSTQDGLLSFLLDKNGNRTEISYPGGVKAQFTFDFADREQSLTLVQPGQPNMTLVSSASYYAAGPLKTLALGNGVTETRTHDLRYFPDRIRAIGSDPARSGLRYGRGGQHHIDRRSPERQRSRLRLSRLPVLPDPRQRSVGNPELDFRQDR